MSERTFAEVERLRQLALASVRAGNIEDALPIYDQAIALAIDEETRELISINKADAMIAIERSGPEVQALPTIVMRRRNLRHVYLAAYALVFKYRTENELKRATFYGQLALQTAEEANEPFWKIGALNELGSIYDIDSKFSRAIECFEQAVGLIEQLADLDEHRLTYGITLENLGAAMLLDGQFAAGLELIEKALPSITSPTHRAEAFIDLSFGHVNLKNLDEARRFGEAGLELATDPRQLRNAHYLLGEVAYEADDVELAHHHFDELSKFYPDFQHLKPLLFAIDLRSMVNLKL